MVPGGPAVSAVTVRLLGERLAAARANGSAATAHAYVELLEKAPRLVLTGHLARVAAATLAGPRLCADVDYVLRGWLPWAAGQVGYAVRPYDDVLDARRWRWQPRGRCGFGALDPQSRAARLHLARARLGGAA